MEHTRPSNQQVWTGNKVDWAPAFHNGGSGRFTQLFVLACYTGAESSGADLLFAMAKTLNATVTASNGAIVNDGTDWWIETGSIWTNATPTFRPDPIPVHNLRVDRQRVTGWLIRDHDNVRLHAEESLNCSAKGNQPTFIKQFLLQREAQRNRDTAIFVHRSPD